MPTSLTSTLIQATILNAISNILAQIIDQHKKNKPFSLNTLALLQFITYAIIIVPINLIWQKWLEAQYPGFPTWRTTTATATATATPIASNRNSPILGPSKVPPSITRKSFSDDDNDDDDVDNSDIELLSNSSSSKRGPKHIKIQIHKQEWKQKRIRKRRRRSGLYNFTMKFILDQSVGSVLNIVLFIVLINLLKGMSWGRTWGLVCEDFTPIMIARLKYRPVVSALLFTVVPLDKRVVFGSACGVVWGVYLSLYAAV